MMSDENPLPKRLKEARKRAGLSQKQLGIKAGIDEFSSSARMNQYEKGTHSPDFRTVMKLAEVLNLPTAYFYTCEDELAELIDKFSQLDEEKKKECMERITNAED